MMHHVGLMIKFMKGGELVRCTKLEIAGLSTQHPVFQVGLVKFSTYASTPEITQDSSDCYATSLAKATSPNRRALKAWIDGIIAGGGTYYSRGLSKAFDLISNSPNDTESNRREINISFLLAVLF